MIENATITGTFLGLEDHGIPSFMLDLRFEGSGQGFGGYDLRHKSYGIPLLMEILKVVGVKQWEHLKGKLVRIERDGGPSGPIKRIGHIVNDEWLEMDEFGRRES